MPLGVTPLRTPNGTGGWEMMAVESKWLSSCMILRNTILMRVPFLSSASRPPTVKASSGSFVIAPGQDPSPSPPPPSPLPRRLCSQCAPEASRHSPGPEAQCPRPSGPRTESSPSRNFHGLASRLRGTSAPTTGGAPEIPPFPTNAPKIPHRMRGATDRTRSRLSGAGCGPPPRFSKIHAPVGEKAGPGSVPGPTFFSPAPGEQEAGRGRSPAECAPGS